MTEPTSEPAARATGATRGSPVRWGRWYAIVIAALLLDVLLLRWLTERFR